jgi:hypothetical protein
MGECDQKIRQYAVVLNLAHSLPQSPSEMYIDLPSTILSISTHPNPLL